MVVIASIDDINSLLGKAQDRIEHGSVSFVERHKNMTFLNRMGISIDDALFMVTILKHTDYYRGPTPERDSKYPPGDMWEFGIPEELSEEVYVKLKELHLCEDVLCMSFHNAEFPVNYPYRNC